MSPYIPLRNSRNCNEGDTDTRPNLDAAIRSIVRSGGTEAREDVPAGHQMDLEPRRAPIRRSLYSGRVRPQAMLVRSGAQPKALQSPSVSQPFFLFLFFRAFFPSGNFSRPTRLYRAGIPAFRCSGHRAIWSKRCCVSAVGKKNAAHQPPIFFYSDLDPLPIHSHPRVTRLLQIYFISHLFTPIFYFLFFWIFFIY